MKLLFLLALNFFSFRNGTTSRDHIGKQGRQETLPVIVSPAPANPNTPMVLMISGDGGWKGFDQQLAAQFVNRDIPVVSLNALKYFWSKKTPEQATAAVATLLEKYMGEWNKKEFILVGFSFGADVMPFVVNRLNGELSSKNKSVALLSPGTTTDFEIHISQMLNSKKQWKYNVVSEINKIRGKQVLCLFGDEEHAYPVKDLPKTDCKVIFLKGGHHYEDNKEDIAKLILGG